MALTPGPRGARRLTRSGSPSRTSHVPLAAALAADLVAHGEAVAPRPLGLDDVRQRAVASRPGRAVPPARATSSMRRLAVRHGAQLSALRRLPRMRSRPRNIRPSGLASPVTSVHERARVGGSRKSTGPPSPMTSSTRARPSPTDTRQVPELLDLQVVGQRVADPRRRRGQGHQDEPRGQPRVLLGDPLEGLPLPVHLAHARSRIRTSTGAFSAKATRVLVAADVLAPVHRHGDPRLYPAGGLGRLVGRHHVDAADRKQGHVHAA